MTLILAAGLTLRAVPGGQGVLALASIAFIVGSLKSDAELNLVPVIFDSPLYAQRLKAGL